MLNETTPPEGRLTRRDSQRKYRAILAAGTKLFIERGFVQTSMDAVSQEASVSKRTVYVHFNSKEELFSAVVRGLCNEVVPEEVSHLGSPDGGPLEVLTELGTVFLTSIYTPEMVSLFQMVVSDSRQFPEIGKMFLDGPVRRSQGIIHAYLQTQVKLGKLHFKQPDLAAVQFMGMLKTDLQMRLLFSQKIKLPRARLREIAACTADLFLHGAAPLSGAATGNWLK
jgi:TetR/AcrR family transcriptional repressor of mexJK operon